MNAPPIKTGQFPFFDFARQFDVWQCTPMDQGGRLVQLELIGSETDEEIVRAVRDPQFFAPWGQPIQWDRLEATTLEQSVWLNRWYVLPCFARGFFLHRDRRYLDDLLQLIRAWARDNPPPVDTHVYFATKKYIWRDMQVAWRTQNLTWCYFLGHDGFTDDERAELFGMISDNARVLHEYFGTEPETRGNHQSHAASAMLYAGVLFPELPIAVVLQKDAIRMLEHHLEFAFYPDGNSVELSPGYYPFITSIFRDALMICRANGLPIPRRCEERLKQCRDYLHQVSQPDGTMPPINDSSETHATTLLKTLDDVVPATQPNDIGSRYFESSGQAVMRDDDHYLFADAGALMLWHWHGGKMGFHLWSGGERFIVDSGVCNYDNSNREKWYCAPPAHNTLLIGDQGDYDRDQLKLDGTASADCRVIGWQSTPTFDCLTMIHGGFVQRSGMHWVRTICLIKNGFVVLVDQVFGERAHRIGLPFHFAPGQIEFSDAKTCLWRSAARTGALICADESVFENRTVASGLISHDGKDTPASIVTFSASQPSLRSTFLMTTFPTNRSPPLSLQQKIDGDQLAVETRSGSLTAHIRLPLFSQPSQKADVSIAINNGAAAK